MLLALDTSTRQVGLALYEEAQVIHEATWISHFHHTTQLAPAIALALEQAGRTMADIQVVGVALGPGSFTSLRVGLALAKGIALSRRIPLVGVPTLDVVAAAQPLAEGWMVGVVEAGRSRLGVGWYAAVGGRWQPQGPPELLTAGQLLRRINRPTWICGELTAATRKTLQRRWKNARLAPPAQALRRPAFLAELAWARWQGGETASPASLAPIYLLQADEKAE